MTRQLIPGLLALIVFLAAIHSAGKQHQVQLHDAGTFIAAAPAPTGGRVSIYRSSKLDEHAPAVPLLVEADGPKLRVRTIQELAGSTVPTPAVWRSPDTFFLQTDEGIELVSASSLEVKHKYRGATAGLAISPDKRLLAFWKLGTPTYTLTVVDEKFRVVKTWAVAHRFESEPGSFDLAFSRDGRSVYARTFDVQTSTPLKRFPVYDGKPQTVDPDCLSVVGGHSGVYAITLRGKHPSLVAITSDKPLTTTPVVSHFPFQQLYGTATKRCFVAQDWSTKRSILVNVDTGQSYSTPGTVTLTVLADGREVYFWPARISVEKARCR